MTNSSLFAEAKRYIPGGVNSPARAFRNVGGEPFFVSRAQGSRIWDVEGREYIDYVGTWGPAILGHAPEVVVEAVRETAKNGLSFGIPNPLEVDMARLICNWVPCVERVRMVNSGTEATMSCIRLARGFTGRKMIVKFEGCYHGHVDSLSPGEIELSAAHSVRPPSTNRAWNYWVRHVEKAGLMPAEKSAKSATKAATKSAAKPAAKGAKPKAAAKAGKGARKATKKAGKRR